MSRYEEQGGGQIVPGLGARIVEILDARTGAETLVELDTGATVSAQNSAFGRDVGAAWEHTTLNIGVNGRHAEFISTASIVRLRDPVSGTILYDRENP